MMASCKYCKFEKSNFCGHSGNCDIFKPKENKKCVKQKIPNGRRENIIYVIMVMTELSRDNNMKCPEFGSSRLVGWYSDFEDAYSLVSGNSCDINNTCYQYALIEECEEGLYNPANKRWWFEYNREKDHYSQINEPDFINGFCGFTIG